MAKTDFKNYVGKKFGKLLCVDMTRKKPNKLICKCLECGKISNYKKDSLDKRINKTCGCVRNKPICKILPEMFDVTKRYGNLELIDFILVDDRRNSRVWAANCICHRCNEKAIIKLTEIRAGRESCKCSKFTTNSHYNNLQYAGCHDLSATIFDRMKRQAFKRGIPFNLTMKDIWEVYEKQNRKCVLSGINIKFSRFKQTNTASLDRIDNDKPYDINNIQIVHKYINIMRNAFSIETFISLCKKVHSTNLDFKEIEISHEESIGRSNGFKRNRKHIWGE